MVGPSLRELCCALMSEAAPEFLARQWSDGRFSLEPERKTEEWNFFDQQFLLAAAVLYTAERPDNPWAGSPQLWEAILRHGRHLLTRVDAAGAMRWNLYGVVLPQPFVCQRLVGAWLQAYQLLKERLPETTREEWRATLLRTCAWLWEHGVAPFRTVTRFTAHELHTSTNHFSLYLSVLWQAGREFDRPEWTTTAADLMRRVIAAQRPGGYWEEHQGPALGCNFVTCQAVDEYTTWSGDPAGREALLRSLRLHADWTYPDGVPIECLDGRMRHLHRVQAWGLAAFTHWPEGRGYTRLLLERLQQLRKPLAGEAVARIATAYLLLTEGEEATPPQRQEAYRATLDGCSVVRKQGPWVAAISGQCSPPWPENGFMLDRQAALSLWHAQAGLVLDGSNSKAQPELATFRLLGEDPDCLPQRAEIISRAPDEEAVALHYRGYTATVAMRLLEPPAVEFRVAASGGQGEVLATVVPHVRFGETITIGGVGEVTLGEAPLKLGPEQHEGWIGYRGITLRLPPRATLRYPISPFNSYSADHTSSFHANRMVVTCPLREEPAVFRAETG